MPSLVALVALVALVVAQLVLSRMALMRARGRVVSLMAWNRLRSC